MSTEPLRAVGTFAVVALLLPCVLGAQEIEISGLVERSSSKADEQIVVSLLRPIDAARAASKLTSGETAREIVDSQTVDAAGHYVLSAPGPGVWQVLVEGDGRATLESLPQAVLHSRGLEEAPFRRAEPIEITVDRDSTPALACPLPGDETLLDAGGGFILSLPCTFIQDGRATVELLPEVSSIVVLNRFGEVERIDATRAVEEGRLEVDWSVAPGGSELVETEVLIEAERARPVAAASVLLIAPEHPTVAIPLGQTDDEGRITIRHAPHATLVALAPSGSTRRRLEVPEEASGPLRLRLEESVTVSAGAYSHSSREPIAGALLLTHPRKPGVGGTLRSFDHAITDADGRASLSYAPPWLMTDQRSLTAWARGFRPSWGARLDVERENRLGLYRGATLVGQVTTGAGDAVAGARIAAFTFAPTPAARLDREVETVSDAEGNFTLDGVPTFARMGVDASHPRFASSFVEVRSPEAGTTDYLDLTLTAAHALTGTVFHPQGEPASGADVYFLAQTPYRSGTRSRIRAVTAVSAEDGSFELTSLPHATGLLRIEHPSYPPYTSFTFDLEGIGSEIPPIWLVPGVELRGRVRDDRGAPVVGATLGLQSIARSTPLGSLPEHRTASLNFEGTARYGYPTDHTTDAQGRFVISPLHAASEHSLFVQAEGHASKTLPGVVVGSDDDPKEPLEIVLERAGRITGRAESSTGEPLELIVGFERSGGVRSIFFPIGGETEIDDEGGYTITGLPPGGYVVTLRAEGHATLKLDELTIEPGEATEAPLAVLSESATIVGVVTDASGAPMPARLTYSFTDRGSQGNWHNDLDGTFEIEDLPLGRIRINARRTRDGTPVGASVGNWADLVSGTNRVDIVLSGATISGRVVDPSGAPVPGAWIYGDGPMGASSQSAESGEFEIYDVPNGSYTLRASAAGIGSPDVEVEVGETDVTGVELRLARTTTITGEVVGLSPEALETLRIRAGMRSNSVRPDGTYELTEVPVLTDTVVASSRAPSRRRVQTVELTDAPARVDFDFSETGPTLRATFTIEDEPGAGLLVLLRPDGDGGTSAIADYRGVATFTDVQPGTYTLISPSRPRFSTPALHIADDTEIVVRIGEDGSVTMETP